MTAILPPLEPKASIIMDIPVLYFILTIYDHDLASWTMYYECEISLMGSSN